jgi:hypothetical protein
MRRQGLSQGGETLHNLGLAAGVAGLAVALGAAFMPSDRMMILFKWTAPYSVILAGATALVVGPSARRSGYNDAVDRLQGLNQAVPPQVQQQEEPQARQAPALPPVATHVAQTPVWSQSATQQHYVDRQPVPMAPYGSGDMARNGHRQSANSVDDGELY